MASMGELQGEIHYQPKFNFLQHLNPVTLKVIQNFIKETSYQQSNILVIVIVLWSVRTTSCNG